jgi:hypothetical protein
MDTKVTTVIVNDTKHGLTMKVGNRNCYARLTSVKRGGEYKLQIDVNWTNPTEPTSSSSIRMTAVNTSASPSRKSTANLTFREIFANKFAPAALPRKGAVLVPSAAGSCGSTNSSMFKI